MKLRGDSRRFASALAAASYGGIALSATLWAQQAQPTQQVQAEFVAICERARTDSEFFGRGPAADDAANSPSPTDPAGALQRANDAVRLGDFEDAVRLAEMVTAMTTAEGTVVTPTSDQLAEAARLEAMAHFLAAEDANCLSFTNAASCILPLQPEAVHRNVEPIERAIDALQRWLTLKPEDPEARWLLNLSHMLRGDYPEALDHHVLIRLDQVLLEPSAAKANQLPRMRNAGPALGIDGHDHAGGAVIDDFDGDGRLDLISSSWDPCSPVRAYRSIGSGFEDVTSEWGLDLQLGGLNLVHADVDNDGALDLLVLRGAWSGRRGQVRNSLLLNRLQSGGGFVDVTYSVGLAQPAAPTQAAAFADFDLDGDLDLYVGNESAVGSTAVQSFDANAQRAYSSQLFENQLDDAGSLRFRDVARQAGVRNLRFAKGVAWGDIDSDGDPDLFVSNIGQNRLYLNLGNGRFNDVAEHWGVDDPSRNFAAWFFDVDNDGDLDLFNADYGAATARVAASLAGKAIADGHPRLYRNEGRSFVDISIEAGLRRPMLPMGANYGDLDGDGFLDIVLGTGVPDYTAVHPNLVYRNVDGIRFVDATASSGMGHLQKGHAVAFGDIDHDGDLDVFEQLGGAFPYDAYGNALYLNPMNDHRDARSASGVHRNVTLELRGTTANRYAVGARVAIKIQTVDGAERIIYRTVSSGGSFGGSSFRQTIGLGTASKIAGVAVRWPGASESVEVSGLFELGGAYRLTQGLPIAPTASQQSQASDQPSEFGPTTVTQLSLPTLSLRPGSTNQPRSNHHPEPGG